MNKRVGAVLVSLVIILAGCGGAPSTDDSTVKTETPTSTITQSELSSNDVTPTNTASPTDTDTPTPTRPPALDHRLYGLIVADNRPDYADQQGITYRNGSVQAVIELRNGATLPGEFTVDIEVRHDRLIQGYVAVESLVPLANHKNVSAVRPPREPQPS